MKPSESEVLTSLNPLKLEDWQDFDPLKRIENRSTHKIEMRTKRKVEFTQFILMVEMCYNLQHIANV